MAISAQRVQELRVRRMVAVLTQQRSRRRKRPPMATFPSGAQLEYTRTLLSIQRLLEQSIRDTIFRNLPQLVVQAQIERPDAVIEIVFDQDTAETITKLIGDVRFEVGQRISVTELESVTGDIGQNISRHNQRQISRQIQSTVGIDVVTAEPWLAGQLSGFRRENVNLITSLFDTQLGEVENILLRGQRRGLRVEVLREQIQKRFSVSRSRANLIARDQTNKLNGQLTQLRQTSLGIEEYIWRTSQDEKVRDTHRDLDGTTQKWNDPPVTNSAGDRNNPGEDFQCRCFAEPVIAPLLEATGQ